MKHVSTSPLTTLPGQIVGWIHGRPVYTIAGGAPDADQQSGQPGDGGQPAAQSAGQQQSGQQQQQQRSGQSGTDADQQGGQPGQQQSKQDARVEDLPDWAQKIIHDTRNEAAANRTAKNDAETKQRQTLDTIAKALGLKQDEHPDPAKLAADLATAKSSHADALLHLAVYRAAGDAKADPAALLDSKDFDRHISGQKLDPSAADYADKIKTTITQWVKEHPKFAAAQAAAASSVDTGGSGEGRTSATPKSLDAAVATHYGT